MLVLYDFDSNSIIVEPMRGRSGPQTLAASKRAITLLTKRGLIPQLRRLDNEASTTLQKFMTSADVHYQLVPLNSTAATLPFRTFERSKINSLPV
jgi:hypothetical protein